MVLITFDLVGSTRGGTATPERGSTTSISDPERSRFYDICHHRHIRFNKEDLNRECTRCNPQGCACTSCCSCSCSLMDSGSVHSKDSGSRVQVLLRDCIIAVRRAATMKYTCDIAIPRILPSPFLPPFPTICQGPALLLAAFHEFPTRPFTCSTTQRASSKCAPAKFALGIRNAGAPGIEFTGHLYAESAIAVWLSVQRGLPTAAFAGNVVSPQ